MQHDPRRQNTVGKVSRWMMLCKNARDQPIRASHKHNDEMRCWFNISFKDSDAGVSRSLLDVRFRRRPRTEVLERF